MITHIKQLIIELDNFIICSQTPRQIIICYRYNRHKYYYVNSRLCAQHSHWGKGRLFVGPF